MNIKLLCMDMDGTLLEDDKNISERNLKAIKAAHDKGVRIAVCTGRIFVSAYYFADLLRVEAPIIASNGSYIREKDKDEVIYQNVLTVEQCDGILNILEKHDVYFHCNTYNRIITKTIKHSSMFYEKLNETLPVDMRINIEVVEDYKRAFREYEGNILKFIVVDEDKDKLNRAKQEILDLGEFEAVSSWHNNFEVMNKGVSKGRAVALLADSYGISRNEVMCMGDSENDLSMITYAGVGVAMGNASDFIKKEADFVTDTNVNDGVAKAIEKFILNN